MLDTNIFFLRLSYLIQLSMSNLLKDHLNTLISSHLIPIILQSTLFHGQSQ